MLRRLCKFAKLGAGEKALLLRALCVVCFVRLGLWLLPFRWLKTLAGRASSHASLRPARASRPILDIANAVSIAARNVPAATCLTQALAAQIVLGRAGHSSLLRIGVQRAANGVVKAHAWVECDGQIIIGGDIPQLLQFTALPPLE